MKFLISLTLAMCLTSLAGYTQKTYNHGVFWGRVVLADTINNKLKWELYLQKRTQDAGTGNIFEAPHFVSLWPWLTYSLSKSTRLSVSPVGYFNAHLFYNATDEVKDHGVKEFRTSVRLEHEEKSRLVNYTNRYTIEYRMRDMKNNGNYLSNWRARYQFRLDKPLLNVLSKDKPLTVFAADEIFVQFGGEAVRGNPNIFDQNRINIGLSYEVVKNIKVSASYLNIIQSRISGKEFDNANAFWTIITFDNLFSQFKKHTKRI